MSENLLLNQADFFGRIVDVYQFHSVFFDDNLQAVFQMIVILTEKMSFPHLMFNFFYN